MKVLVLYHCPCPDGAFAALAARLHFGPTGATYMPHSTSVLIDLTHLTEYDIVYLLDYCGPHGFIAAACQQFKEVYLIDHHKTAVDEIRGEMPHNFKYSVRMDHSGCILALEWFSVPISAKLSRVFDYIEDHDIWRHKLPYSEEFTAGLRSLNLPYDNPAIFDFLLTLDANVIISFGKPEIVKRDDYIAKLLPLSQLLPCGSRFYETNDTRVFYISEIGHKLAESAPSKIGIVAYGSPPNVKLSLRSVGGVDTTFIAARYDGGGHVGASGCIVSRDEWEQIKKRGCF